MPEDRVCPNRSLPISDQTDEEQRQAVPPALRTGRNLSMHHITFTKRQRFGSTWKGLATGWGI